MAIMQSVVDGMAQEEQPYVGILYGGFMVTPNGPKVLEFNCRFGDPETQAVLALLGDEDLVNLIVAASEGRLDTVPAPAPRQHAATVVMASGGYPGPYDKGVPITGISDTYPLDQVWVFHAGTRLDDDQLVTSGGRVLGVTGLGSGREQALERAYAAVELIQFSGAQYRRDIGRTQD
jgi:phosphoribosylamine-glycine ligase